MLTMLYIFRKVHLILIITGYDLKPFKTFLTKLRFNFRYHSGSSNLSFQLLPLVYHFVKLRKFVSIVRHYYYKSSWQKGSILIN